MDAEDLVRTYIKIRNAIQKLETEHKNALQLLETDKDAITAKLLELCNGESLNGFKTDAGTVSRKVQSRFWASDWEEMYAYVNEHQAPYLLEKRIHNGNMKEFLQGNKPPQGLQVDNKYVISVRKPPAS